MTTDRWTRVAELFARVQSLSEEERSVHLDRACGGDLALRREVASLLEHHDRGVEFLESPALGDTFSVGDGERLASADDPVIGHRIGPYEIVEEIGAGGMGTVYRGLRRDGVLDKTVAIKLLHPWRSSPRLVERFQREWQALARLTHPCIARVFDAGVTETGTPFLIMEHVAGLPVDTFCDERRLGVAGRLALFEAIAHAVHFAHQNLVIHCDLKPANILVTADGQPVLLDFGIAKVIQPESGAAPEIPTMTKMMTPDYASPEQIRGEPVTTATDVYSLGVVLYELLCGRRPYRTSTTSMAPIESILADSEPPRPSTAVVTHTGGDRQSEKLAEQAADGRGVTVGRLRRQLRGDLDNIVLTALRKDPSRRYSSAEQLAEDIRRHLDGQPVKARPDTILYRTRKLIARNRWASAGLFLATISAAVGGAATARQAAIAAKQAEIADAEAEHARIEASSARRIADVLTEAFLLSAPSRTEAELAEVDVLLGRHASSARRQYEGQPHERANILDALGRVYLELGLFDGAGELIDEAAAIRGAEFGDESLEAALSLGSQGELAYRRGDHRRAAAQFERALELHRSLPRGVHTDVAHATNDLAVTLRLLGEVERAATLHAEALALRRHDLGENHPAVAESLNNLAVIQLEREQYSEAEESLLRVLDIRRQSLGPEHPLVAQALNNLAAAALHRGQHAEAERRLRSAIELYRSMPGVHGEALARTLTNLASLLRLQGDTAAAREAIAEALALHRQRLGTDRHPHIAAGLHVLAGIELDLGERDSALEHYAELLELRRELHPAGHPKIGATLCSLGAALLGTGNARRAETCYREALELFSSIDPPPQAFVAACEHGLGQCLIDLGRREGLEEAEPLLLSAHRRFGEIDPPRALATAAQLHRLYLAWDKPEQARAYERR